jgi:hypothetical protein
MMMMNGRAVGNHANGGSHAYMDEGVVIGCEEQVELTSL